MEHELKLQQRFFDDAMAGRKPFELRVDDRPYTVGDTLKLREWAIKYNVDGVGEGYYSGRVIYEEIIYILRPDKLELGKEIKGSIFGLSEGFCILGTRLLKIGLDEKSNQSKKDG